MKRIGILVGMLAVGGLPLFAGTVRFDFAGTVTQLSDLGFVLDETVEIGTPFSGYYTFETTIPDSNAPSDVSFYWFDSDEAKVVVKVGDYVFRSRTNVSNKFLLSVVNRATDGFVLRSYANICSRALPTDHISWQLDDPSGTAFDSDVLPDSPPELAKFEQWFGLTITGGSSSQDFFIRGRVNSIRKVSVNPPTSPAITSEPALELRWKTDMGYFYQLQSSSDLSQWTNIGAPVLGDGSVHSEFVPSAQGAKMIYRAVITNHDRSDGPNSASIKNFVLRGRVTSVNNRGALLDNSVIVGAPIDAFYTFSPDRPDTNSLSDVGDYWHYDRQYGVAAKIGNYVFASNPDHVRLLLETVDRSASNGGDHYLLRSYNNLCSHPLVVEHISWQLDGNSENAVSGDQLPATPPKLSDFSQMVGFTVRGGSRADGISGEYFIRGVIDSISEQPLIIPNVPPVQIHRAEQLRWQSDLGALYQVQSSDEGGSWSAEGNPMIGDGSVMSYFVSLRGPKRQFRVILAETAPAPVTPLSASTQSFTTVTTVTRQSTPSDKKSRLPEKRTVQKKHLSR